MPRSTVCAATIIALSLVTQAPAPGLTPAPSAVLGLIQPQNFGYTSKYERHRVVIDGIAKLPHRFLVSSIAQLASARPYSMSAGVTHAAVLCVAGDNAKASARSCWQPFETNIVFTAAAAWLMRQPLCLARSLVEIRAARRNPCAVGRSTARDRYS